MSEEILFLGGGGDADTSKALDLRFFKHINHNSKILYIPIAWDQVKTTDWIYGVAKAYVDIPQDNIHILLDDSPVPAFDAYDAIYIGGGNTYRLLDYLAKNNLIPALKDYISNKGKIYGGSAGAIILGKDIATVAEEKESYPDNNTALDLCNGYSIRCHYKPEDDELLAGLSQKIMPILALPENGGLIYDNRNNLVDVIGEVYTFSDGKKHVFNK